jgi:hypothetical protein
MLMQACAFFSALQQDFVIATDKLGLWLVLTRNWLRYSRMVENATPASNFQR